ncbi:MAG: DUF4345 domain-containing protein [Thermosynechococcaceae cyanobacterium]
MHQVIIYLSAIAFAFMGLAALVQPARIPSLLGVYNISKDMKNEIRAVYGGFGCGVSLLLVASTLFPSVQKGIILSVSISLLGMAIGRIISFTIDGATGHFPFIFLGIELVTGGLLLYVFAI